MNEDYQLKSKRAAYKSAHKKTKTFTAAGKSQLGLANEDLNSGLEDGEPPQIDYKSYNVMEDEFEPSGLKVKDAIEIIKKAQEEKKPIVLPGQFWDGCEYNKVIKEEYEKLKPKKHDPIQKMQAEIQRQFLRDQGKTKRAEQAWFDKLEAELERFEMDELLRANQGVNA
jgi:hypothetical protein